MTAIGSGFGFGASDNWFITQSNSGSYRVVKDADGTGAAPVASDELTEQELNALLASQNGGAGVGFQVVHGVEVPLDSYSGSGGGASQHPLYSAEHAVQASTGPVAPNVDVHGRVSWMNDTEGCSDAALLWMSMSVMAQSSMRDISDARKTRTLEDAQKNAYKEAEITATQDKIEAEKKAADEAVTTAWVGAAISTVGGAVSGAAAGAGAVAGAAAGLANGLGNVWLKSQEQESLRTGAKAEANRHEVEAKVYSRLAQVADDAVDDAKSNYEAAKETLKAAMKLITDHYEQQTQIVNKIFQS